MHKYWRISLTALTCVNGTHHLLKHLEADVGDWDDASLLFFVVPVKHCPVTHMCFSHVGDGCTHVTAPPHMLPMRLCHG